MHVDGYAMRAMLEDKAFRRTVFEELAIAKPEPFVRATDLVVTMLVRKGVPRDRGQLVAVAYITGLMLGLGLLAMEGEKK